MVNTLRVTHTRWSLQTLRGILETKQNNNELIALETTLHKLNKPPRDASRKTGH